MLKLFFKSPIVIFNVVSFYLKGVGVGSVCYWSVLGHVICNDIIQYSIAFFNVYIFPYLLDTYEY